MICEWSAGLWHGEVQTASINTPCRRAGAPQFRSAILYVLRVSALGRLICFRPENDFANI